MGPREIGRRLTDRPWPITLAVFVPWVLYMSVVQAAGLDRGLIHRGIVEYWVHGIQPDWAWVPYIHPPGYSGFMNAMAWLAEATGVDPNLLVLHQGFALRAATLCVAVFAAERWLGSRWALVVGACLALSPNGIRPFEHYPLSAFLGALAFIAIVELRRRADRDSLLVAVLAVFVAVEIHLSNWFVVGGMMAAMFVFVAERRRMAVGASLAMIGAFFVTTYPGLFRVLSLGAGNDDVGDMAPGGVTFEWINPVLLLGLAAWFVPKLARRSIDGFLLAMGCVLFSAVTVVLQHTQVADGQPYPYGLHYYELIEVPAVLAAAFALAALWRGAGRGARVAVGMATAGLVLSQGYWFFEGQTWIWMAPYWFWATLWPFG